jgi:hypothetical protein
VSADAYRAVRDADDYRAIAELNGPEMMGYAVLALVSELRAIRLMLESYIERGSR